MIRIVVDQVAVDCLLAYMLRQYAMPRYNGSCSPPPTNIALAANLDLGLALELDIKSVRVIRRWDDELVDGTAFA